MSDPLPPRPQYGEYASPEEQRQRAGLPPAPAPVAPPPPVPRVEEKRVPADRPITIALLVLGLLNVLVSAPAYLDLSAVMDQTMQVMGIPGEFTNFGPAKLWGTVAAFALITGWVVTTLLAVMRIRAGKRSWWIPLLGAVITFTVTAICLSIPMMGDPAFLEYLDTTSAS